jgi:hypothetical protein
MSWPTLFVFAKNSCQNSPIPASFRQQPALVDGKHAANSHVSWLQNLIC